MMRRIFVSSFEQAATRAVVGLFESADARDSVSKPTECWSSFSHASRSHSQLTFIDCSWTEPREEAGRTVVIHDPHHSIFVLLLDPLETVQDPLDVLSLGCLDELVGAVLGGWLVVGVRV